MKKRSKYRPRPVPTYSLFKQMLANPDEPMAAEKREGQIGRIRAALEGLRSAEAPGRAEWDVAADCINLLETLVRLGDIRDEGGWIAQGSTELAEAAKRSREGLGLRMTPEGLKAIEEALEGYEAAVTNLPERRLIEVHRLTEMRLHEIQCGRSMAHDIEVISL